MIHELRHTESGDPGHANCRGGRNDGAKRACDETFNDGKWVGSGFNADMYFFSWALNRGRGNELSKSVIQSNINAILPDRFNRITAAQIRAWRK